MNNKCIYYVEGPCEQQLIAALKEQPAKLIPGKIKVFNVVQNLIPKPENLWATKKPAEFSFVESNSDNVKI